MASSEHTLKLKAVLDTSQVRGQLNQIRNQANQAFGTQQQRLQNSAPGGQSASAALNSTLRNLQISIDRLSQAVARNFAYARAGTVGIGPANLATVGLGGAAAKSLIDQYDAIQKLHKTNRVSAIEIKAMQRQYIQNVVNAGPRQIQGVQPSDKFIGRSLIAYGTSHLASSGQEYAEAAGYSGVGKALGFGGYVAGGALAGSIIGPAGIAIGAAIGGVSFALKELAESAKKTASALAESEMRVRSARSVQHGWLDFQRQRIDAEAARRQDAAHFIGQQAIAKSEAGFYRSQLESSVIGSADPAALRAFESRTRQLLKDKAISADQAGVRNKVADQWKDTFSQMQKALQLADSYNDKVEQISKSNEKNLEAKQKELEAFEKQETIAANLEKYAGDTAKLSGLAKTSKLNLDIAKGAYASLLKSGDVSEFGLETLSIARTSLQQAQQEYQAYSNALKQSEASDVQKRAALAAQELAVKQSELSQLQKRLGSLSAPNLEQVTSLAGSGLMISKKDDEARLQVQEGFEREQTSIQRQILQKMDEIAALDTSGATYS